MRVAVICPDAPPDPNGGLGTYLDGICGQMAGLDAEVHVVGTSRDTSLPSESKDGALVIHRIMAPRMWADAGWVRRMTGLTVEYLRLNWAGVNLALRHRADVVAVHDWMCAPAGIAARLLGLPCVYHVHSAEVFFGGSRKGLVSFVGRGLTRLMAHVADAVVVPTRAVAGCTPPLAHRSGVHVIGHGAGKASWIARQPFGDLREVRRRIEGRYGIDHDCPIVLYVGRLAPQKGVLELLEAFRQLDDVASDPCLVVVGTGLPDRSIDVRLRLAASCLGLERRVYWSGCFLGTADMVDHMRAARVCVFPSTHEGFGFVALEAMAVGARVVVGPGYDPDVVASGSGVCIRVASVDPQTLSEALRRGLDRDYRPNMGERARDLVLRDYSWRRAAVRTLDLYRSVAQVRHHRPPGHE